MLLSSFLKFYWLSIYNKIMTKKSLERDVIRTSKKYTFGPTHGAWLDFCMKTYGIPSNIFVTLSYICEGERGAEVYSIFKFYSASSSFTHTSVQASQKCSLGYDIFSSFYLAFFYYFLVIFYLDCLLCSFDTHACIYSRTHKYIRVYYYYNFVFFKRQLTTECWTTS